jgi:hypothetical protein
MLPLPAKYILGALLALLAMAGIGFFMVWRLSVTQLPVARACSMEAKICPDGTAVGRTGPNCEFVECPRSSTSTPVAGMITVSSDGNLDLAVGQTGKAGDLNVTINAITADSRCPVDVQCIRAGDVRMSITLEDRSNTETRTVSSELPRITFDDFIVTIVSITPERKSKTEILPEDYRITLHVAK